MTTLSQFRSHPPDTLSMVTADYLATLTEYRGRQELFTRQSPQQLKSLREHSLIESAVSSNRIEGVEIERTRVQSVVLGKARLRDRPEEEVRGYRDALALIHGRGSRLPLNEATILRLHRMVRGEIADAGQYKSRTEPIIERYADGRSRVRFTPVKSDKAPRVTRELLADWDQLIESGDLPPPVLMAAFNLDFLCIHPFRDGNGRLSRLLFLLQTYHLGFEVGRYVSLERLIEQNKDRYYETLEECSQGWHQEKHNPWPFINFMLYIMKVAYREFEERLGNTKAPRGTKTEHVQHAVGQMRDAFSMSELEQACPGVSRDLIRRVLRSLQADGQVECLGRGPGAQWRRKGNTPKKR